MIVWQRVPDSPPQKMCDDRDISGGDDLRETLRPML
jgi:hypothetical protein